MSALWSRHKGPCVDENYRIYRYDIFLEFYAAQICRFFVNSHSTKILRRQNIELLKTQELYFNMNVLVFTTYDNNIFNAT